MVSGSVMNDMIGFSRAAIDNTPLADPLIAFAFLDAFTEILQDYFGIVSVATLKDNFDIVYQVRGCVLMISTT